MMEGSSLRMMVGMYSALGTLEEMSWGTTQEAAQEGPSHLRAKGHGSPGEVNPPLLGSPQWSPVRHPHPLDRVK